MKSAEVFVMVVTLFIAISQVHGGPGKQRSLGWNLAVRTRGGKQTPGYQYQGRSNPKPGDSFVLRGSRKCEAKCRGWWRSGAKPCSSCCNNQGFKYGGYCEMWHKKPKCICTLEEFPNQNLFFPK